MIQSPEELISYLCVRFCSKSDDEFIPRYREGFLRRVSETACFARSSGSRIHAGKTFICYLCQPFYWLRSFLVFVERSRLSFRNVTFNLCMDIFDSAHPLEIEAEDALISCWTHVTP